MRTDDIFNDIDSKTADRLAKEYPVLKDEQKERLYAMSKRKFDIKNENNSIDVSGVEKYRRPKWYKGVSVAAAAILLTGGIGSSMYFISRNGQSPSAEVEESISVTTEAVTEELTEIAEEDDADTIAKELTDDWMECLFDIHGRTLEVDKSAVVTKTITSYGGDEITRDFYRVIDPRYPTWADLEKRCYEVCDAELAKIVLDACGCAREEDMDYTTLIFTTDDGYYVNTETCDTSDRLYKWLDDEVKGEFDENGNIITTRSHIDLDVDPDHVYETRFTIVKTENGWRISKAEEKYYEVSSDNSQTNPDTIAKELTGAYRDFANDLHGGNLEVDKNNVITKTIISSDGVKRQREFYRVTDPRYPAWADIEKRCYEIFDEKFGKVILDNCMCDKEEDINYDTFMYTTDNGYYIEKSVHDDSMGTFDWDEDNVNVETDENGNIITILHRSGFYGDGDKYTVETDFIITNTENGWRISKAGEKLCGVPESDNYEQNIQ